MRLPASMRGRESTVSLLKRSYGSKEALDRSAASMARFIYRPVSFYLAVPFVWLGWPANWVTLLRIPLALLGAVSIAFGSRSSVLIGTCLFVFGTLLDFVDGNLARFYGTVGGFGHLLDHLVHIVERTFLPIAIGIGLYRRPDAVLTVVGFIHPAVILIAGALVSLAACLRMIADLEIQLIRVEPAGKSKMQVPRRRSQFAQWVIVVTYRVIAEISHATHCLAVVFAAFDAIILLLIIIAALNLIGLRNSTRSLAKRMRAAAFEP